MPGIVRIFRFVLFLTIAIILLWAINWITSRLLLKLLELDIIFILGFIILTPVLFVLVTDAFTGLGRKLALLNTYTHLSKLFTVPVLWAAAVSIILFGWNRHELRFVNTAISALLSSVLLIFLTFEIHMMILPDDPGEM